VRGALQDRVPEGEGDAIGRSEKIEPEIQSDGVECAFPETASHRVPDVRTVRAFADTERLAQRDDHVERKACVVGGRDGHIEAPGRGALDELVDRGGSFPRPAPR